ncbi:hypothetical protein GP486_002800 [Trichoglossum hirsutum]|uniref:Mg2+ transporter protein n=1 Tax=Trichoglossum hirsutum TaxID=265104 RepID=A0A9P8LED9_9PEZI|nr:hypothetical protein GP486_002800 [Trichoglossum hirsutum]
MVRRIDGIQDRFGLEGYSSGGGQLRLKLSGIIHGSMKPGGDPATLIVLDFRFMVKQGRRIRSANINLLFEPVGDDPDNVDVEVVEIAPQGNFHQGVHPLQHEIQLRGKPRITGRVSGSTNTAAWQINENDKTKGGIPSGIRTSILLRRKSNAKFQMKTNIQLVASGPSFDLSREFYAKSDSDDPIFFDPTVSPLGKWEDVDPEHLASVDLMRFVNIQFPISLPNQIKLLGDGIELRPLLDPLTKQQTQGEPQPLEIKLGEGFYLELWNSTSAVNTETNHTWKPQSWLGELDEKLLDGYFPWVKRESELSSLTEPAEKGNATPIDTTKTPFYSEGFWSLILVTDDEGTKGAAIIQSDAKTDISTILQGTKKYSAEGMHPLLILLQLFEDHVNTTSRKAEDVTRNIQAVDSDLLDALKVINDPKQKDKFSNFGRLSQGLHEARMDLVELARRREFEKQIGKRLLEDLHKERALISRANMFIDLSESHDLDIQSLPQRIDSQRTVLYSLIAQQDARLGYRLSREAVKDSKAMKTLAIITIVFLPGTFIATLFATNMFHFQEGQQVRIYFAVTVPITFTMIVAWAIWIWTTGSRHPDVEDSPPPPASSTSGPLAAKAEKQQ